MNDAAGDSPPDNRSPRRDELFTRVTEVFSTAPGGPIRRAWAALRVLLAHARDRTALNRLQASAADREAATTPAADEIESFEGRETALDLSLAEKQLESAPDADSEQLGRLKAFLDTVEGRTRRRNDAIRREIERNRAFDGVVRGFLLAAGVAALVLAVIGIGLAFAGAVAVAVLSGATAVLPAAGSAILFRLSRHLQSDCQRLHDQRGRNDAAVDTLRAIAAIADPVERQRQFARFVEDCRRQRADSVPAEA